MIYSIILVLLARHARASCSNRNDEKSDETTSATDPTMKALLRECMREQIPVGTIASCLDFRYNENQDCVQTIHELVEGEGNAPDFTRFCEKNWTPKFKLSGFPTTKLLNSSEEIDVNGSYCPCLNKIEDNTYFHEIPIDTIIQTEGEHDPKVHVEKTTLRDIGDFRGGRSWNMHFHAPRIYKHCDHDIFLMETEREQGREWDCDYHSDLTVFKIPSSSQQWDAMGDSTMLPILFRRENIFTSNGEDLDKGKTRHNLHPEKGVCEVNYKAEWKGATPWMQCADWVGANEHLQDLSHSVGPACKILSLGPRLSQQSVTTESDESSDGSQSPQSSVDDTHVDSTQRESVEPDSEPGQVRQRENFCSWLRRFMYLVSYA